MDTSGHRSESPSVSRQPQWDQHRKWTLPRPATKVKDSDHIHLFSESALPPSPKPWTSLQLKKSRLEGQGSWSLVTEAAAATTGRHTHQQEWNAETAITYEHECLSATANSFRETQRWKPSSQHKGHTAPVSSRCSDTYQLRDLV
ncbi:mCG1039001 [Mus musculus]|nr:mCG1039001 [Mus musculus]